METTIDKECGALGGLFQQIIQEMKQSSPVWEDFLGKSAKLHTALRATIQATGAFLEAFQRVADMATNTRGATREIGAALTRLCMRHKSIENRLKHYTMVIMEKMVVPMQDRLEEWKRNVLQLDKDHAKEYKRARAEIKKAASDTFRLQKKVKKGKSDMQNRLDNALQDVNDRYRLLEETEKNAVRLALIEQRSHFCQFLCCLKPVVDDEIAMLTEVTHLQEIIQALCMQAGDPTQLPASSEQVILDLKGSESTYHYQSPPSSPSSIGSRKSSMCSISSVNSSSSGSSKSHSPSHVHRRSASQQPPPGAVRLSSVSSQDSGFTSQDTLFLRPPSPSAVDPKKKGDNLPQPDTNGPPASPLYAGPPSTTASTWTNWPDPPGTPKQENDHAERPHTISSAYEKMHSRPSLTSQTFEPPEGQSGQQAQTAPSTPSPYAVPIIPAEYLNKSKPPINRDPKYAELRLGPKPKARPVAPPSIPDYNLPQPDQSKRTNVIPQPVYMNMNELATMAVQEQRKRTSKHEAIEEQVELEADEFEQNQTASDKDHEGRRKTDIDSALSRAILELDTSTAALNESSTDEDIQEWARDVKVPNSLELAEAIRELEASTAELQMSYDPKNNRHSLQCSSGYGTMNSTPSVSEDTISSGDMDSLCDIDNLPPPMPDRFYTLPRPQEVSESGYHTLPFTSKQSEPDTGEQGTATIRRASQQVMTTCKPPPPIRRSSSITYAAPVVPPNVTRKQSCSSGGSNTPTPQSSPVQMRRTLPGHEYANEDDLDLPPPEAAPPPIVGQYDEINDHHHHGEHQNIHAHGPIMRHSITASHAGIISSLNKTFLAKHKSCLPQVQSAPCLESQSSEDITPTEQLPRDTLMNQIRRGVSLRRTSTNDRSFPRIS